MELYKYTGSVAALTVRFGKAETITLYDSYDDSVAPVRLDVRGALAEYIKKIEGTDSEDYPPADALASIRACAEQERVKYETWLNGLSPAARREYQLERLPLPEFLEELRKAKEEREGA